jgi:hypothetical protein
VATFDFQTVLVWTTNPGGVVRLLRNGAVTVYNAATDAALFNLTSDSQGLVSFTTTDVPTVYLKTTGWTSGHITAASAIEAAAAFTVSEDAAVANLVNDPGSSTRAGLNSTVARLGSLASTAVQYVSTAGNDSAAGTSWGAAKATVGAAVAAIASTGGRVLVGPGTFPLAASLALAPRADQTGIEVVGAGAQLTILTYAGADAAVIIGDGSATDCRRTYLRHLSIVGTSAGLAGVRFNSTRFCGLDNVEISGFTIPGGASVRMLADVANYFNVLKECKFNGSTYGVRLDGGTGVGANSNYIRNCHFSTHASDGLLIDAGDSNRVEDCEFNGGTATGVRLVNNAVGNVIMGNQFDGTTTMWNVVTSAVTDSMFLANTGSGTVLDSGTRTVRVDTTAVSIFGWRVGTDGKTYAAPGSDTATGATAGSATLPAAPVGFFSMRKSDGTQVKVPYYGF